jgi:hypothetical protein
MKIHYKILSLLLIVLIFLIGCTETTTEPETTTSPDYYPSSIGSTFKYSVIEKDSAGNLIQTGTRNILFSGTSLYNGINYTTQDDSLDFGSQSSVSTYLVRKSETGVFYAVDTAQISLLIPDSLKQYVTLRNELQLLFYPLTSGSSWSLYRITAEIQPNIEIKILDIIARFEGTEQIDLNIDSVRIVYPSRKVSYNLELFTEIGGQPDTYTAYMWYVQNIGLIKFEGNQFVIGTGGGGITFEPSPNILTQELVDYCISE